MLKVLIVDDDPCLASLFRTVLERHSCEVLACHSVETALQLAVEFSPKRLLCDLNVNAGNGIELAHRVKTLLPDCKIILMSGADVQQIRANVDPAIEILQKPIGVRDVLRALAIEERKKAVNE